MSSLIAFLIIVAVVAIIARIYVVNDTKIKFYTKGMDSDFKLGEINTLWKLAKKTKLEEPISLFLSTSVLNDCISQIITEAKSNNTENSYQTQQFLSKLYKYRTRITLDHEGKKGLEDTRSLDAGQRLRIILPGKGVFASVVLNNGRELVVSLPRQEDKKNKRFTVLEGEMWEDHHISVYFWRKGDAGYAFDTQVFGAGVFQGQDCLFLRHSNKLDRAQKRQSVRCVCNIYAQMYMIKSEVVDYNAVDTEEGYRCLLEDISEDGAMIRIGGIGKQNARIKLQFELQDTFIMMYGIIRAVEYNKVIDQSRLHFECTHIDPTMKNAILSYVYNVIPENEKDINEALIASEEDSYKEELPSGVVIDINPDYSTAVPETKPEEAPEANVEANPAPAEEPVEKLSKSAPKPKLNPANDPSVEIVKGDDSFGMGGVPNTDAQDILERINLDK
ncbi:MAG: PilZ domain-containing protein [Treponema sp.]|nr:PilZ domain-containing protein [Treponema sp.]